MRIVCISDTHGLHDTKSFNKELQAAIDPNQYNLLLHGGDLSSVGREEQVKRFVWWFQNLKGFDSKIFVAGNHDMSFEGKPYWLQNYINEENLSQSDCVYLEDNGCTIELPEFTRPLRIWGSPWQPFFLNWGFNLPRGGEELRAKWAMIPDDTDILLTHCPPHNIRDYLGSQAIGCERLRERVDQLNLALNVFGHIHNAYGAAYVKNTLYVNASLCNEGYDPVNKPIVLDLYEIDGRFDTIYNDAKTRYRGYE